jgi:chromosome segregation ATPase
MSKTNVERTLDTLVDFADLNRQATVNLTASIEAMGDRMEQANQRLSDRIDQMNTSLVTRIDDLAIQISNQAKSIGRLEKAIADLTEESKTQLETAKLQTQNVAELIRTVRELAIARG